MKTVERLRELESSIRSGQNNLSLEETVREIHGLATPILSELEKEIKD